MKDLIDFFNIECENVPLHFKTVSRERVDEFISKKRTLKQFDMSFELSSYVESSLLTTDKLPLHLFYRPISRVIDIESF